MKKKNKAKKSKDKKLVLNEQINSETILLIDGENREIIELKEALQKIEDSDLDIVCVAPNSQPPVCKLINRNKYLFELKKKNKIVKVNSKTVNISFSIEENDLQMKLNKIKEWVEKGMVVKIVMKMKGREKTQPDLVLQKCKSIIRETEEKYPKIELKDKIYNQPNNFHFFLCKKR